VMAYVTMQCGGAPSASVLQLMYSGLRGSITLLS
jgi:hypothetical protein